MKVFKDKDKSQKKRKSRSRSKEKAPGKVPILLAINEENAEEEIDDEEKSISTKSVGDIMFQQKESKDEDINNVNLNEVDSNDSLNQDDDNS